MNGLSLAELAVKLEGRISPQALSKYEQGEMKPNSEMLILLSQLLNVRPDYFSREVKISLQRPEFRKLKTLAAKDQAKVVEQASDFLERYIELEEMLQVQPKFDNPIKGITVSTTNEAIQAAAEVRKQWNLGDEPLFNALEFLEDKGFKVFEIDANPLFKGMSALHQDSYPIIVLNKHYKEVKDMYRFTALHELAHLLMVFGNITDKEKERMCDAFAGAMLLPATALSNELGTSRNNIHLKELILIKEQYGASLQAILYRAKNLNIISDYYLKSSMVLFSKWGYRKNEPGKYNGVEHSSRFLQLLCRAVAEEVISLSKAAALNNQKLADFRETLSQLN